MKRYRVEVWEHPEPEVDVLLGVVYLDCEDSETAERRGREMVLMTLNVPRGVVEARAEVMH